MELTLNLRQALLKLPALFASFQQPFRLPRCSSLKDDDIAMLAQAEA